MTRRVWVVGPIAWDSVIYINQFPSAGGFAQSIKSEERPGGTAGNVALALSTTGVETGFVSYLGEDDHGRKLGKILEESEIKNLEIKKVEGSTSHVLVAIDNSGNRTILGLNESHLDLVSLDNVNILPGDVVCFVLWRPHFINSLKKAREAGCITVLGIEALDDLNVKSADLVIGSLGENVNEEELRKHLHRFRAIVVTLAEKGSMYLSKDGAILQKAIPATVVDTTGAGDSFLAGYLAALAHDVEEPQKALEIGSLWAAETVSLPTSVPPPWSTVRGSHDIL